MDPILIDPDVIYAKTASGEEAMLQRTRVVQRNLRMVLILVDGNATVAELCNRTGNAELTQNALLELENDGFVERRAETNSVWAPGGKARRAREAGPQPPSEFSRFGNPDESAFVDSSAKGTKRPDRRAQVREERASLAPASLSPSRSLQSITGQPSGSVFLPEDLLAPAAPAAPPAKSDAAPSRWARWWSSQQRASRATAPDLKPIRRGVRAWRVTWPVGVLLGVVLLAVLTFLVALFFPYPRYLPEVEAGLTRSTGRTVKAEAMRVSFYPKPGLLLSQVRFGDESGNPLRIAEINLQPLPTTLFATRMVFNEVTLRDVHLSAESFASLAQMLESAARTADGVGIQRVALEKAEIAFAGLGIGDLSGNIALSAAGLLQSVSLHSPDNSLTFAGRPLSSGMAVRIEGFGWRPAAQSPFHFDSLLLKGEVQGSAFVLESIEMNIFGGLVQGGAVLRAESQPSFAGEISFERVNLKRLGEALGIGGQFEGAAAGKLKFSASAESWPATLGAIYAEGPFTINRGSLGGIDLPEAVRRVSPSPGTIGGATRFEQLSGAARIVPGNARFSRLVLSAGQMQSTGQFEILHDLQIRGRMEIQMRARADQSATAVAISGPLKNPQLQIVRP